MPSHVAVAAAARPHDGDNDDDDAAAAAAAAAAEEELEMVLQMYSDECERVCASSGGGDGVTGASASCSLVVHLPHRLDVHIVLPTRDGYPHTAYPDVRTWQKDDSDKDKDGGGDGGWRSEDGRARQRAFVRTLRQRMHEELCLGYPTLLPLVALAHTLADAYADEQAAHDDDAAAAAARDESDTSSSSSPSSSSSSLPIEMWVGEPITDRKSRFLAHVARVDSVDAVRRVVAHLRAQRSIAAAAHPTIYAYRFTDAKGVLHTDCDDDGEHGASTRLVFLLDQMHVDGYVVVVTRWFGGILLGPDRYKHIMEVARNVLQTLAQRSDGGDEAGTRARTQHTTSTSTTTTTTTGKAQRRRR